MDFKKHYILEKRIKSKVGKLHRYIAVLLFVLISIKSYSHSSWKQHADDMMSVFGFVENSELREWMRFISSDMIDKTDFYEKLKNEHNGFGCKHRLLFHWGYNAEPWNRALEEKVKEYCENYDLNIELNIRVFKSKIRDEQKRRNRIMNEKTETLFGFSHGGKDARYAQFFVSIAYNIHLIGDYTSDNTDLQGLQNLDDIIGLIISSIKSFDIKESKTIVNKITTVNKKYSNPQIKADELMLLLKKEMPDFIKKAENGSIRRRLEKKGFKMIN